MGSQGPRRQISRLRDQQKEANNREPRRQVSLGGGVEGACRGGEPGGGVTEAPVSSILLAAPQRRLGHSPRAARPAHEAVARRPANGPCCAEQVSHVGGRAGGWGGAFHSRFISTLPMWLDSYRKGFLCPPPLGVCTVQGDERGDKRVPRWPWAPHPLSPPFHHMRLRVTHHLS